MSDVSLDHNKVPMVSLRGSRALTSTLPASHHIPKPQTLLPHSFLG